MAQQHPCVFCVYFLSPNRQVHTGLIAISLRRLNHFLGNLTDRFLIRSKITDHLNRIRMTIFFFDRTELGKGGTTCRSKGTHCPNTLSDLIDRCCEFCVLGLKEQVERREHRTSDIPVIVVGLDIQRISTRKKFRKMLNRLLIGLMGHTILLYEGQVYPKAS